MGKNFLGKLFGLTALFIMVFTNVFANDLPKSTDIVVIGGGGARLTVAISAHEKGAKVILVEKNHVLGGNTNYATGGFGANPEMVEKYNPALKGFGSTNNSAIVGDGIIMVEQIGGDMVDQLQVFMQQEKLLVEYMEQNRLGGNAVTYITVFGKITGENAATYSKSVK